MTRTNRNSPKRADGRIRRAINAGLGSRGWAIGSTRRGGTGPGRQLLVDQLEDRTLLSGQALDPTLTNYFSVNSPISGDLTAALQSVDTQVLAPLGNLNIPIIGNELKSASDFVGNLSTTLTNALQGVQLPQDVANAVNMVFGSGSGTIKEIATLVPTYFMGADGTTPVSSATDEATNVVFNLDLTGSFTASSSLSFNLGLPAVSLTATGLNRDRQRNRFPIVLANNQWSSSNLHRRR